MKIGELSQLYYRAAQLNVNIRDFWSFIETYDPPTTEDGAKTDWKGAIAWLRFRIPQVLNHQKEGNIFHFIETTAKIVDEYFKVAVPSGQYVDLTPDAEPVLELVW